MFWNWSQRNSKADAVLRNIQRHRCFVTVEKSKNKSSATAYDQNSKCRLMSNLNPPPLKIHIFYQLLAKKRQRTFFSKLVTAIRPYVLGKDTWRIFFIWAKQFTYSGGPAREKTCKQNPKNARRHRRCLDFWLVDPKPQSNDVIKTFQKEFLMGQKYRKWRIRSRSLGYHVTRIFLKGIRTWTKTWKVFKKL